VGSVAGNRCTIASKVNDVRIAAFRSPSPPRRRSPPTAGRAAPADVEAFALPGGTRL